IYINLIIEFNPTIFYNLIQLKENDLVSILYTHITIQNNQFLLHESENKPENGSALSTLKDIEKVIQENLPASGSTGNGDQNDLHSDLIKKAKNIQDRYIQKTKSLCLFIRFFWGISKKEKQIQETYQRIATPLFESFDTLVTGHICKFLSIRELCRLSQVNKTWNKKVKDFEIECAKSYGYKKTDFVSPKQFLESLCRQVHLFVKDSCISKESVVWRGAGMFRKYVDWEATLRNINLFTVKQTKQISKKMSEFYAKNWHLRLDRFQITALISFGFHPHCDLFIPPWRQWGIYSYQPPSYSKEMQVLIDYGADPNHSYGSNTLLGHFTQFGDLMTIKVLLKSGASPNVLNKFGETPLVAARYADYDKYFDKNRNANIITTLLSHGANVDFQHPQTGRTALHDYLGYANYARKARYKINIKALLEFGANPNLKDHRARSPLDIATIKQNKQIIQLLTSYGAK
ncbi:MAG: hypothetical protein K940chlam9_01317, partial [Chlamydiae bacterium]|nr:hypothetical protein [Chlamydiota bacterium]